MMQVRFTAIMGSTGLSLLFFLSAHLSSEQVWGQQTSLLFSHSHSIPVAARQVVSDHLQNIYAITALNEVSKYSKNGQLLFTFNDNTQGQLSHLDASNPLNLLLFYEEFQTLMVLDRTLTEQTRINLSALDIPVVTAVGWSRDNQIWVYDDLNFKLKKINTREEITATSENLSLILPQVPHPIQIAVYQNWIYLNDPQLGLLVFDQFAQFDRIIPVKNIENFQIIGDFLLGKKDAAPFQMNLQTNSIQSLSLPEGMEPATVVYWQKGLLTALQDDAIQVFTFSLSNDK